MRRFPVAIRWGSIVRLPPAALSLGGNLTTEKAILTQNYLFLFLISSSIFSSSSERLVDDFLFCECRFLTSSSIF